jgi:hypothetical protein
MPPHVIQVGRQYLADPGHGGKLVKELPQEAAPKGAAGLGLSGLELEIEQLVNMQPNRPRLDGRLHTQRPPVEHNTDQRSAGIEGGAGINQSVAMEFVKSRGHPIDVGLQRCLIQSGGDRECKGVEPTDRNYGEVIGVGYISRPVVSRADIKASGQPRHEAVVRRPLHSIDGPGLIREFRTKSSRGKGDLPQNEGSRDGGR